MTQNYRRLGLISRLKAPTGGVEKRIHQKTPKQPLSIKPLEDAVVTETRVERDASGRITRIIDPKSKNNPLNDPLNQFDSDEEDDETEKQEEWTGIEDEEGDLDEQTEIVRQLEEQARQVMEKRPRHHSDREQEWLERLVAKHGDDVAAMARDRKLNPMQQTEGDLARRIRRWKVNA